MVLKESESRTRRSAASFALAVTLAVVTFWIGGVAVNLYSYGIEPAARQTTAKLDVETRPCPIGADKAMQCEAGEPVKVER